MDNGIVIAGMPGMDICDLGTLTSGGV